MSDTPDGGNGRVTLAILGEQMRQVIEGQKEIKALLAEHVKEDTACHSDLDKRLREQEQGAAKRDEQISTAQEDIKTLKGQNILAGGIAVIASAVIGFFKA